VLCPQGELWVDVEAFEQADKAARRSRDPAAYRSAIDLYAGELLPEDRFEEWTEEYRLRLREIHLSLLVAQVAAGTVGVREQPGRPLGATLAEDLRAKNVLLVLDNCEHLIEAVARFTDELIGVCPKLRILATSREPLHVPGEVVRQLSPLPVPEPTDPALLTEGGLARLAVTRLFLDRAHRRKDDSTFSGRGVQVVVDLYGCLPLAGSVRCADSPCPLLSIFL
jgi:hypothetical protein